ncbi:unnamed protein product [Paramecium pentaurelia]|uniref:Protein kinase domain-containing protein n=2 Tax=Paramecium pentaurelia TaxID=43138 RepID=A0A8S1TCG7_9CILI|nr:unnamed protein product [Paramecium pentaurelia]
MITDEPTVEITKDVLQGLKIQKIYKDFLKEINSIDFSQNGQYLVACDDQVVNVFDIANMKKIRTMYNNTQEIDMVKFTKDQTHVICVTKNEPYEIWHWAFEENQILKKFSGHTKIFDDTLRLWELNQQQDTCYAVLDLSSKPDNRVIGAFDFSGNSFGMSFVEKENGQSINCVQLYQIRKFELGPYQVKKISGTTVIQLKFSADNQFILCVCSDGQIQILDSYLLNTLFDIPGNADRINVNVCFTPDSKFLITGSNSGYLYVISIQNAIKTQTQAGQLIAKLEGHQRKCKLVLFNPKYCCLISTCRNLVHYEFINSNLVIEEIPEEIENDKVIVQETADENKIKVILVNNQKLKQEFLIADNFSAFTQVLIISTINHNQECWYPPALKLKKKIKQNNLFQCFYQDINIGFITSTGQIKSTAFIYVHKTIREFLIKKICIDQKQERVRFLMHFFKIENIIKIPYVHQDYKNQFLKTNKFKNEFIILSEEIETHQSLFQVYKLVDDQIYYVKRIHLRVNFSSSFMNVFNTKDVYINIAKILASLSHPNVIRLYDWWIEMLNFQPYLFMQIEYCIYPRYISQAKNLLSYSYFYMNPMPHKQKQKHIQDIILQIIQALEFLKLRKIHLIDLKPENIMVTITVTGDLQIVLADFNPQINNQQQQCYLDYTFQSIGTLILNLILTFPGDATLRNNYITKFLNCKFEESLTLLDSWAQKVKNRNREFSFQLYKNLLLLVKSIITESHFHDFHELKKSIQKIY